ncbi:MAG TPA: phosphoenolpyruvate--protein phosphotransferase [Pyrinomonadaceae bacterium]|nr:phosphoenolpyruvate--protein phosphotransferase [Pyrinomonadaceae bacterium]
MSRKIKGERLEQRWQGVAVSEGLAAGRVLRIHSGVRQRVYRATLAEDEVERETRRFRAALRLVRRQLHDVRRKAERALGAEHAYIFEAHLLMLEDRKFLEDIESYIRDERVNAEWAVKVVADRLLAIYAEITDEYLRERSSDVEDVIRRILVALSGEDAPGARLTHDAIIVAEELMPSAAAELDFAHVKAIASDGGGWTSHTAIIARGLGIPAVVGLRELYRHARTGDEIIVDARTGEVVLHPTSGTQELHRTHVAAQAAAVVTGREADGGAGALRDAGADVAPEPVRTLDGVEMTLRANVELPAEYAGVRRFGARGIGLYRSEFLLSQHDAMPSEDEQCAAYVELAALTGADGATIRLFDLGGDKLDGLLESAGERNPALGLRAIRFCLQREDILRTQVRAVLRAAAQGRLDLVLPMISDITDVRRTRAVIEEERARLQTEGRETGALRIGAMIEVPSAVLVADKLAREVDFFSLGTNDLIQYLLAVDRSNDEVAGWFRSLHPAVLQSISRTLDAAAAASIPAVVCGEMAASPAYAFVLAGLGARDLSMTASSIPRVRRMLRGIEAERARAIAAECLECATADDVEELVGGRLGEGWPNLFPPEILPAPNRKE